METDKCACHERDSSYTCDYCKRQGYYGHMERPSEIKICYVYFNYEDFTSSCDPIRIDLVVDGNCIETRQTPHYMQYKEAVNEFVEHCECNYDGVKIHHVCVRDGDESYTDKG